jgi:hypothetical protein
MLIRLVTLTRRSATDEPIERVVAIDPEIIARIEDASETEAHVWCDGMNKPYVVSGRVDDVLQRIQQAIDEQCEPETYATE